MASGLGTEAAGHAAGLADTSPPWRARRQRSAAAARCAHAWWWRPVLRPAHQREAGGELARAHALSAAWRLGPLHPQQTHTSKHAPPRPVLCPPHQHEAGDEHEDAARDGGLEVHRRRRHLRAAGRARSGVGAPLAQRGSARASSAACVAEPVDMRLKPEHQATAAATEGAMHSTHEYAPITLIHRRPPCTG